MLRQNKQQYFYNLWFATHKDFWKAVKLINKQDTSIPALWDGSASVTSNIAKAELLNSYFYECFNHLFPPLNNPTPLDPQTCPASILCTEEQVTELLRSLETTKSTGLDGVSALMFRQTAFSIAPSLTKLLNLSITTSSFQLSGNVRELHLHLNLLTPHCQKIIALSLLLANFLNSTFTLWCSST